jgi:hypothetical protein
MRRSGIIHIGRALAVLAVAAMIFATPAPAPAQNGATNIKTQATLLPPDGATNTNAKGKAKTQYRDNGNNLLQKLTITLQQLERRTDYRIMIDGLLLGVFAPKGNSGTLKVNFRTPPKGNQDAIPLELGETRDFLLIEVFNDETGELVLVGDFVPLPAD